MMENLPDSVWWIADFLGREVDCNAIADKLSIESNRKKLPDSYRTDDRVWWHNHIDTGEVGRWKTDLTTEQLEIVNRVGGKWQRKMRYE